MWQEQLSETSTQAGAEAALEQYVEKPHPTRDWFEWKLRQAPWWCISFLVHILALLLLWTWPVPTNAQSPPEYEDVVSFWDPTRFEKDWEGEREWDILAPPPPRIDTKDFEIGPVPQTRERSDTQKGDAVYVSKEFDGRVQEQDHTFPQPGLRELIQVDVHDPDFLPSQKAQRGTRDQLRRWLEGDWKEPGRSKGVETEIGLILTPLQAALMWLAQAQEKDGSWDAKRWEGASPYRVGMTGLALLAFEGAGFTHIKGKELRKVVAKGLGWLRESQRPNGSFPWETFYEQGIATMALCEAYGMTGDSRLRASAQGAVDYIVKLQPEHGGFRYAGPAPQAEGDMSVTGWQIMAIKSALLAGLRVPPEAVERSRLFLKNTWRDYGASSYLAGDKGAGSLSMTSVGLLCRLFLNEGGAYEGEIAQSAQWLVGQESPDISPPEGGASRQLVADLYYTYYSSLAMYHVGGPDSEYWRVWKAMHLRPLAAAQVRALRDARGDFVKGSFDPAKHRWGDRGGRVFTTAMAALAFEAPFRFLPVCQTMR